MFTRNNVSKELKEMVLVKLYTDRKNPEEEANKKMQMDRYNSVALPLYVILTPDEELIESIEFTRDENEFIEFLKKGTE